MLTKKYIPIGRMPWQFHTLVNKIEKRDSDVRTHMIWVDLPSYTTVHISASLVMAGDCSRPTWTSIIIMLHTSKIMDQRFTDFVCVVVVR
jgi:hypothetical protein